MHPAQGTYVFNTRRQTKFTSRVNAGLYRLGAILLLAGVIGGLVYSSSLASGDNLAQASLNGTSPAAKAPGKSERFQPNYLKAGALAAPLLVDGVTIQENTCSTPQVNFNLNDTICITVTGFVGQRVVVVDPQNLIRQEADITTNPQGGTYQIPNTVTTSLYGGFVDQNNLGTWHVYVVTGMGLALAGADFVVKDPAQATANVEIFANRTGGNLILSGDTVTYDITMVNYGPDAAVNASFTTPTPAFTTFQAVTPPVGVTCTDPGAGNTGDVVCTAASLAANTRVTVTVEYEVGNVGVGSSIGVTATVDTDTANISTKTDASSTGSVSTDQPPSGCTLTCPANITTTADTTGPNPADPGGPDVSGANVTFSTTSGGSCGTVTSSPASGSFFPVGTTTVTSSSSEGGGECSFTVTVTQSGDAVSITCPSNKVANAGASCTAIVNLGAPTTTGDNVTVTANRSDGLPMYDCDVNGENCVRKSQDLPFPAGNTTVTWTATNSSGSQSCTQTVTVYDVTPPTITAGNQAGSADANCQAPVPDFSTLASVSDNCACASSDTSQICDSRHDIVITQDIAPGTLVGLGPHTIQLTANDEAVTPGPDGIIGTADDVMGNVATVTVTFTVVDNTAPTFTFVPANVTAYTGAGATTCDTVVDPGTATATDNCSAVTITRSPSGNTFPVGTTTITWTAKDVALNTVTATQTVTVIDNTPPVISCPSNIVLESTCPTGAIGTYTAPVGTDNCPGATTTRTAGLASGAVFPIGTTTVTHTVNDAHGNSASCSFTVTVLTPQAVIQNLISSVNASSLTGTQKNGLLAKLNAALDGLNNGQTNVACNKLSDFVNNVGTLISHGDITAAQGNAWILSANHVRNTIGCTNNPCS